MASQAGIEKIDFKIVLPLIYERAEVRPSLDHGREVTECQASAARQRFRRSTSLLTTELLMLAREPIRIAANW